MTDIRFRYAISCLLLVHAHIVSAQTGPNFCSFAGVTFTCDYGSMGTGDRPIDYTGFSESPQDLVITVNGFIPYFGDTQIFSTTFNGLDISQFDPNRPASLTVDCGWGGSVYIDTGAFYNMSYVQRFKIRNCDIYYIGTDTVDSFGMLDYFGIEGGTIDGIEPDAFSGLSVEKMISASHSFPRTQGRFEIVDAKFVSGSVSPGLLFYFSNLTSAALKGAGLTSISTDTFKQSPGIVSIDISDNLFDKIPTGLFGGLNALSEVHAHNIEWKCECSSLWWVAYAADNNITMLGDFICSNVQGTTVKSYYYESCVDNGPCAGGGGIEMGSNCQSMLGIICLVLAVIALTCAVVSLVFAIMNLKEIKDMEEDNDDVQSIPALDEPQTKVVAKPGVRPGVKPGVNPNGPKGYAGFPGKTSRS